MQSANLPQKVVVLHVSRANLQDVHLFKQGELVDAHHLCDDGKPSFPFGLHQHLDALSPKPLKGVGGSPGFEGASPQNLGACCLDGFGDPQDLLRTFHGAGAGNEAEAAAANPDLGARQRDDRVLGPEFPAAALEGLRYPLYLLHNLQTGQQLYVHSACLAHQGESCVIFPGKEMGLHPLALEPANQAVNLVLGGSGFDDDDHMQFSLATS
ncbi:unknown [Firmicutes bacterium CAG:137]|nr:unknown [Firmicutes bacterium CAG:137]